MTDPLIEAGAEAVEETARSMLVAAGESLMRHGDDPNSEAILAASMSMIVTILDRRRLISKRFRPTLIEMLQKSP